MPEPWGRGILGWLNTSLQPWGPGGDSKAPLALRHSASCPQVSAGRPGTGFLAAMACPWCIGDKARAPGCLRAVICGQAGPWHVPHGRARRLDLGPSMIQACHRWHDAHRCRASSSCQLCRGSQAGTRSLPTPGFPHACARGPWGWARVCRAGWRSRPTCLLLRACVTETQAGSTPAPAGSRDECFLGSEAGELTAV